MNNDLNNVDIPYTQVDSTNENRVTNVPPPEIKCPEIGLPFDMILVITFSSGIVALVHGHRSIFALNSKLLRMKITSLNNAADKGQHVPDRLEITVDKVSLDASENINILMQYFTWMYKRFHNTDPTINNLETFLKLDRVFGADVSVIYALNLLGANRHSFNWKEWAANHVMDFCGLVMDMNQYDTTKASYLWSKLPRTSSCEAMEYMIYECDVQLNFKRITNNHVIPFEWLDLD